MTHSENTMMRMRPVGLRIRCVKPLPCGMRSFIFCLADFSSDLATTGNSLMPAGGGAAFVGQVANRLPTCGGLSIRQADCQSAAACQAAPHVLLPYRLPAPG